MAPTDSSTTKYRDLALCSMIVLLDFGDSVEMYLPGVITQVTSCELGVSEAEEAVLGVSMFVAMAVAVMAMAFIGGVFSNRTVVLASLYISIIATVICSLVHNYTTLLLSRIFVGFSVGSNVSSGKVLFSNTVSSVKVADWGLFVSNFLYVFGSGWVSILGYIFLDMLGWRNLILLCSIPWFIPPILLFHFYLTPSYIKEAMDAKADKAAEEEEQFQLSVRQIWCDPVTRTRMLKISGLNFLLMLVGNGLILLLPSLLRAANLSTSTGTDRCEGTVDGNDFLIQAGLMGGVQCICLPIGFYAFKKLPFRGLMALLTSLVTLSFGVVMVWDLTQPAPDVLIISITVGVVLGVTTMQLNEVILCIHDHDIFPSSVADHTSAVCWIAAFLGVAVGNIIAASMDPKTAVQVNFGLSLLPILLSSCVTERMSNKDNARAESEAGETTLLTTAAS